jgi:creatinine amidohydrolase/Fe(II)-dependent formamide hydrolase-like protein
VDHGIHEPLLGSQHTGEEKESDQRSNTLGWYPFRERNVDLCSTGVFGHEKQRDATPEKGGEVARFDSFVLHSKRF